MDLIAIIAIIVFISKIMNKAGVASSKVERYGAPENIWDQLAGQVKAGKTQARQYMSNQKTTASNQNEQWKKFVNENVEKARRHVSEKLREVEDILEVEDKPTGTYKMPKRSERTTPAYEQITLQQVASEQRTRQNEAYKQSVQHRQQENKSAMQQVHAGRTEARNTSILERAVKNTDEDKVDITLETLEREHNHSERVSTAEHHHPEDVISESTLGTIEDLMVKGYEGNLCFERDFVGEAMDMLGRFTVPTEVPDFSKGDVA